MMVLLEFAKDVGRGGRVLHGRVHGGAFARRELVELFNVGVIAEAVGPPARNKVHAVALHLFQQLPAAIGCASELSGFFRLVFGFDGVIFRCDRDGRDGTEIGAAVQLHGFVCSGGFGRRRRGILGLRRCVFDQLIGGILKI